MKRFLLLSAFIIQIVSVSGQDSYHAILKADALCLQNHAPEAIQELTDQLGREKSTALYCSRGEAYLKAGLLKEAVSDFNSAESLTPGTGLYGLARAAALSGNAKGAVSYLRALMKTSYKPDEPSIDKDSVFEKVSSSGEWKSFWQGDWYREYERSKWEIEYYVRNGKADLAREEYADLSAKYPDTWITDYCGALIDIESGSSAAAVKKLTSCLTREDRPEVHLALAKAYYSEGEYYSAALEYGKLISTGYNDASLFVKRAEMLRKAGDRSAATEDLDYYLSLYPEDGTALSLMGKCLAESGELFKALPYMNRNIELHPGDASAFADRGDVYFTSRSWANAISDYSMSLDLNPSNGTVYLNLGISLINSGNKSDACSFLRKALALGEKNAAKFISSNCGQ